ncbi:MAG: nucleotide exchange factor GrpE [Pseudanabaena sp.]|jgi:molecular chaperone GrpE (heat shock protein)
MDDRTEILRLLMKQVGISSFQILSERTGISRRAIDTLRKRNAATLRYADLAKLAEVLQIEVTEVIAKFISDSNNPESPISEIAALREEYQRLQQKLELQKFELRSQFERETIQQLESLILQLPSAAYAAQQNPNMLAKNILPLLRPIDALLQKWGITAIGSVGKEVNFDSQKHQLMEGSDEIKEGDIAIVRYVGYMQGEKLLYRARVSIAI